MGTAGGMSGGVLQASELVHLSITSRLTAGLCDWRSALPAFWGNPEEWHQCASGSQQHVRLSKQSPIVSGRNGGNSCSLCWGAGEVARTAAATLRRICRRWETGTPDLISISAVCSVGWQNQQIPPRGVREAFYNSECARGEVSGSKGHLCCVNPGLPRGEWVCAGATGVGLFPFLIPAQKHP